jgi:hypothetical protein
VVDEIDKVDQHLGATQNLSSSSTLSVVPHLRR